jgi:trafficking protein particle complex subunit 10
LDQTVIPGTYDINAIDFVASNLCLHYDRELLPSAGEGDELLRSPRITIYHRANTLDVSLTPSKHMQLDRNNTVDVDVDSGWNELESAEIRVKGATGGLRLLTSEAQCVSPPFSFSKKPEGGLFCFEAIPQHAKVKIRFPYTVEQEVLRVSIRIDVTYKTKHGKFVFSRTPSIPISLALGVNVQDVFKHKALFSRFTVSTANTSPLRLFKSELAACEVFESSFGVPPANPVVVFPKQPACLLYKITRKKGVKVTRASGKTMYLKLYYSVVHDEVTGLVESSLLEAVKDTDLQAYADIVVEKVLPHVRNSLDGQRLERAALLGSVSTEFLSDIDWAGQFRGLGKDADGKGISAALAAFVKTWRAQNPTLPLPTTQGSEPRSISIPVDIPAVTVVHTTDIRLVPDASAPTPSSSSSSSSSSSLDPSLAVTPNQVLPANLHLRWTRIWDTSTPQTEMSDLEFSYEIVAPADSWLAGGRRKGHFVIPAPSTTAPSGSPGLSSTPETEADIPLLLIPLREGRLSYPSVDIREVRPAGQEEAKDGGAAGDDEAEFSSGHCETDHRNLGETVRVVPDRESVTISLDASGAAGGPLLLDVERGVGGRVVV